MKDTIKKMGKKRKVTNCHTVWPLFGEMALQSKPIAHSLTLGEFRPDAACAADSLSIACRDGTLQVPSSNS